MKRGIRGESDRALLQNRKPEVAGEKREPKATQRAHLPHD